MRSSAVITFLLFFSVAQSSNAQSFADHARVSVNAGAQPNSSTFTTTQSVPIYQQTATVNSSYGVPSGAFFDGSVALKVSGGFGVDVGASFFTSSQPATIAGTIPHPLIGGSLRPISGTASSLERSEIAGHVDAAYVLSAGRVDLLVAAGPAFFTVSQDLAESIAFTESPTNVFVTFTGATVSKAMATALGFDAGVDVGLKLSKNVGVGGEFRYAHASMTFPLVNTASGAHSDAGGLHVGAGLRFYF